VWCDIKTVRLYITEGFRLHGFETGQKTIDRNKNGIQNMVSIETKYCIKPDMSRNVTVFLQVSRFLAGGWDVTCKTDFSQIFMLLVCRQNNFGNNICDGTCKFQHYAQITNYTPTKCTTFSLYILYSSTSTCFGLYKVIFSGLVNYIHFTANVFVCYHIYSSFIILYITVIYNVCI
jgi:hypothetical protein